MSASQKPYLTDVSNIIVVLSGKGGVGKSSVACQLAMTLAYKHQASVGLLDVDICGPSVPKICGVEKLSVIQGKSGWEPVTHTPPTDSTGGSLKIMSIGFLLSGPNDAVVWRGPRKDAMIKQFVADVNWGQLDYLVVDTPPGTSDEHLTLCECLVQNTAALGGTNQRPTVGAVVVTTPQLVATDDVKKELSFCIKLNLRCFGIVENMSGYVCPHCSTTTDIFGRGGGDMLAGQYQVPFLGRIPIDPWMSLRQDQGRWLLLPGTDAPPSVAALWEVLSNILAQVARAAKMEQEAQQAQEIA